MTSARLIAESLLEERENNEQELIDILLDIDEELHRDSKFIIKIIEEIKEIRLEENRCPKCGITMDVTVAGYEQYEAWGSEIDMPITYGICSECSYENK